MSTPSDRQKLIWKIREIVRQYEAGSSPDMCMKKVVKAVKETEKQ